MDAFIGLHHIDLDDLADNTILTNDIEDKIQERSIQLLYRWLNKQRVVGFIGSGISMAYGYPDWRTLIDGVVEKVCNELKNPDSGSKKKYLEGFKKAGKENFIGTSERYTLCLDECARYLRNNTLSDKQNKTTLHEIIAGLIAPVYNPQLELNKVKNDLDKKLNMGIFDDSQTIDGKTTREFKEIDPLILIIEQLGIKRFITTNYDLEIECALAQTRGFQVDFLKDIMHEVNGIRKKKLKKGNNDDKRRAPHWRKDLITGANGDTWLDFVNPNGRLITFDEKKPEDLIQFAINAPGFEMGVFHLHGIFTKPETIIATEEDYQRTYMKADVATKSYHDAIDLLLSGNAILFLGLGLEEADILRPLRHFVANFRRTAAELPFFALIERPKPKDPDRPGDPDVARQKRLYLYKRFGINVIYYPIKSSYISKIDYHTDKDKFKQNEITYIRTFRFGNAIDDLAKDWKEWWNSWLSQPNIRKAKFCKLKDHQGKDEDIEIMIHHPHTRFQKDGYEKEEKALFEDAAKQLDKEIVENTNRIIVVVGKSGTGKGTFATRLARGQLEWNEEELAKRKIRFFASNHFMNESLSILDAADDFFKGKKENPRPNNYSERLFILGGLERVLLPCSNRDLEINANAKKIQNELINKYGIQDISVGKCMDHDINRVLMLARYPSRYAQDKLNWDRQNVEISGLEASKSGTIVIVTSCWPLLLNPANVGIVHLKELSGEQLKPLFRTFGDIDNDKIWVPLCKILHGHFYSIIVLGRTLTLAGKSKYWSEKASKARFLEDLVTQLSITDSNRRAEKVIQRLIDLLAKVYVKENPTIKAVLQQIKAVLKSIAVIGTPVDQEDVLKSLATYPGPKSNQEEIKKIVEFLYDAGLITYVDRPIPTNAISSGNGTEASPRLTIHTVTRALMLHEMGSLDETPAEPQRLVQSDFANDVSDFYPETKYSLRTASHCMETALKTALDENLVFNRKRAAIRGAFGLMHSWWNASSISRNYEILLEESNRYPHLQIFQGRLAKLLYAIRKEPTPYRPNDNGYLYVDELSWIYNELSVAAYYQGAMLDAYQLARVLLEVNYEADKKQKGPRWLQVEIQRGVIQLERGRLSRGQYHLERALKIASAREYDELVARATGYLGLFYHLSGYYVRAAEYYELALTAMRDMTNARGTSIFARHYADLLRAQGNYDEANKKLQISLLAAESGRHPDLLHYARLARANLARHTKELSVMDHAGRGNIYISALDFAETIGIHKLKADVLKFRTKYLLESGQIDLAWQQIMRCLGITRLYGMGLRTTGALVELGRVAIAKGDWKSAAEILHSALQLGERQGYTSQLENARAELAKIPPFGL